MQHCCLQLVLKPLMWLCNMLHEVERLSTSFSMLHNHIKGTANKVDAHLQLYTDPVIVVNHEQEANKSLDLTDCSLSPNLSSLLPRNLVLGSLKISSSPYSVGVLSSFASLDSITLKSLQGTSPL